MIDHYIYGNCNRISPEAPVPVVEITKETYTLGGAGNVLQNLHAFGVSSSIIGVVGHDNDAEIVAEQLRQIEISNDGLIKDDARCTVVKSRVLVSSHQLIRLDREKVHPLSLSVEQKVLAYLHSIIDCYDLILISDYNKGLLTDSLIQSIVSICNLAGKIIIVDPKGNNFAKYKGVNIIKPNKKEAIIASGIDIVDDNSLKAACTKIREITACDSVIVTMSEDGIAMLSDNELKIIPTKAMDVVDVTGAGDTVLAAIGISIASGKSIYEACEFANQAAAIVVSKVGSATATLQEIEEKTFR